MNLIIAGLELLLVGGVAGVGTLSGRGVVGIEGDGVWWEGSVVMVGVWCGTVSSEEIGTYFVLFLEEKFVRGYQF